MTSNEVRNVSKAKHMSLFVTEIRTTAVFDRAEGIDRF